MRFKTSCEWKKYKLKELSKIFDGTHQTPDYKDHGISFVSVEDIDDLYSTSKFITKDAFTRDFKIYPQKNDILMTRIGDIGTPALVTKEQPLAYYVSLALIKPTNNLNSTFAKYMIESKSFQHELWKKTIHVAFPKKINKEEIGECLCFAPNINYQRKIGQFLLLIDERIGTQNKIIEEYQALKNCIIDAIILKSRKIGTCKINKIIEEYNVKTTNDNEYPVLSSTASGIYFQNEYFNKEAASENTTGYKCVPKGYCAYRSMSDTGRFYFNMQSITDVGIVSPAYPVFSVKEDSALFLVSVLNRDKNIIKEILKLKAGGTRFSLPFKKLVELEIPWPDHQTRKHFMKIIRNMIQKIDLEQKILAKYIDQKSYLLNNMFI